MEPEEHQNLRKNKISPQERSRAIQIFSTSVIFSAIAVASSTALLAIPNLETLTIFFFIVGYQYGKSAGLMTVITSVTVFEFFASQFYGSGGLIPFLLKFPPFLLVMFMGVYFRSINETESEFPSVSQSSLNQTHSKILYQIPDQLHISQSEFSFYERFLLAQLGFALTIVFDIFTSLSLIVFVPTWEAVLVSFITGLPFFILHQITNAVLFSTFPSIIDALNKMRPV